MRGSKIKVVCQIDNCGKKAISSNPIVCCDVHYARWYRLGTFKLSKWHKPTITKGGYLRTTINGKRGFLHKHIMEKHLGRKIIFPKEVVHHIDGNKFNNDISNLMIISQSEHVRLHKPANKI